MTVARVTEPVQSQIVSAIATTTAIDGVFLVIPTCTWLILNTFSLSTPEIIESLYLIAFTGN